MRAFILAAGLGTRLGSLTEKVPKCLVPVGGKVMIEHVIDQLRKAGVTEVIINLFHLGAQVEEYLAAKNYGLKIQFSKEATLLGTGGGLKAAARFFTGGESFFVYNADVLSNIDLRVMWQFHNAHQGLATLAVMDRKSKRPLCFDNFGQLLGWEHTDSTSTFISDQSVDRTRLAFSGIHVIRPRIFEYLVTEPESFSILNAYRSAIQAGEKIKAFRMDAYSWIDVGTPEKLELARQNYKLDLK